MVQMPAAKWLDIHIPHTFLSEVTLQASFSDMFEQ
ncbi:unnamed protein product, partial [Didymodactylos carnosus]